MGIQINGQTDTVTATDGSINVGGDVTIPGVLTYEDVTNIDSIGIGTFRNGIDVTSGTSTFAGRVNVGASNLNNRALNAINASTTVGAVSANNHNANGILFQGYNTSVDANNASFVVRSDGSTGIGTATPSQLLHLHSDASHKILLKRGGQYPSECIFANEGNLLTISNNKNGINFDVGSSSLATAMYIEDGGNIGIGTDNPQVQLHLTAADPYIRFQDTAAPSGYSQIMGTHQGAIAFSADTSNSVADSHLRFDVDGTERMRITDDGKVGIGENAPDNLLHLKSTASPAIELEQDDGTSYKGLIKLAGNDLEIKGSNGQMEFYNGSQDGDSSALRMVIQNSGRIHLGTRDGNQNSTIFGVAKVNIVGPDPIATSFTAGGCYLQIGGTESELNGLYPIGFGFRNSAGTHVPAYIAYKTTNSGSNENGALLFATRNVITDTEPSERLRITSGGIIKINNPSMAG